MAAIKVSHFKSKKKYFYSSDLELLAAVMHKLMGFFFVILILSS